MARYTKPASTPGLSLTDRDIAIIKAVHRYRFLSTDQVMVLTNSPNRTSLNARLSLLWGNDYLDRPEVAQKMFAFEDKRPTVHALGQEGARWLSDNYGVYFPPTVDWRAKNKSIKSGEFVKHTLGTTSLMLHVERELEAAAGFQFVDHDELWFQSTGYTPLKEKPDKLPTQYRWFDDSTVRRSTKPDYTFVVEDRRGDEIQEVLYFLEYDRGTEDYVRKSTEQTSIVQKFFGYGDAYDRGLAKHLYGYKRFRVPFVVKDNDEHRVKKMIETYQTHAINRIHAGALLFTTEAKVLEHGFLAPIWLDGKGNQVALHDGAMPTMPIERQPELLAQ